LIRIKALRAAPAGSFNLLRRSVADEEAESSTAQFVANAFASFAEAPLLVDVAEAEAKCDQRNRGYPEGPIGPIQKHATKAAPEK
jgi:hypothetical protein